MSSLAEERHRREELDAAAAFLCGELPGPALAPLRRVRNVLTDLSEYQPVEELGEQGGE